MINSKENTMKEWPTGGNFGMLDENWPYPI